MAGEDWYTYTRAADQKVGDAQDFTAFIAQLLFLIRLVCPIINDAPRQRDNIERNGLRKNTWSRKIERSAAVDESEQLLPSTRCGLAGQFFAACETSTGNGLVGGDDEAFETSFIVQGLQYRHGRHRRAVGISNDSLCGGQGLLRVHLGHHQRNIRVHPPGTGIVDDGHSCLCKPRSLLEGKCAACAENGDVQA